MSAVSATEPSTEARRCHRIFAIIVDNGGRIRRDQLLDGLQSLMGGSFSAITRALDLLEIAGAVYNKDGIVYLADEEGADIEGLAEFLSTQLVALFLDTVEHEQIAAAFQIKSDSGELWVDSLRLPGHSHRWPITLLNQGIFERESIASRHWRLTTRFKDVFLDILKKTNFNLRRKISLVELSARLRRQEELGEEAEEWALEFERSRLRAHPLVENVRRVSEEDVGAGYDIVSFSTSHVLGHDRFIEVKSVSSIPEFYWSENEIEVAKELKEKYVLYLVDRSRMDESNYAPTIISGPYSYFFEGVRTDWSIATSSYRLIAVGRE